MTARLSSVGKISPYLRTPEFREFVRTEQAKILVVICAYNEAKNLPNLLESIGTRDVLVIDDGSQDATPRIASDYRASLISHEKRIGKPSSLADGISYALQNHYDIVVEIDADAVTDAGSIRALTEAVEVPGVGGASCRQLPMGSKNLAYYIDELIWSVLIEGKEFQMRRTGSSHLGAVMIAFKPELVDLVEGCINDDEEINISIRMRGEKSVFVNQSVAYFDASSCLGHIVQRRVRMYVGHMKYRESKAPSMEFSTSAVSLVESVCKSPKRLIWVLPALAIDAFSRVIAWADSRRPERSGRYSRWVTTYTKNNTVVIRNSPIEKDAQVKLCSSP